MKILQVNCVYKNGSTGKIVYDTHTQLLAQGYDSIVCYGRGALVREPNVYKTCGEFYSHINHFWANATGVMYGGCFFSTNRLISIIKKEKPDIVHLHCINGYFVNIYRLVNWLKKKHIKTVLTLHAEFMYTGGCGHSIDCNQWSTHTGCGHSKCPRLRSDIGSWFFDRTPTMWKQMKDAFEGFDDDLVVTSVSPWLKSRAEVSPILAGKPHCVVMNGLDVGIFHPYSSAETTELKKQLHIGSEQVIFHATASFSDDPNHIKGGYYLIELAKRMPDVTFVVAGPVREGIQVPDNMRLLGRISDQTKLAQLYAMADLTVLTSQKETFSMVTAESLCCGTPVVGFQAGGPEQIAIPEYSQFLPYGDIAALYNALMQWINKKIQFSDLSPKAQEKYSITAMSRGYQNVYRKLSTVSQQDRSIPL